MRSVGTEIMNPIRAVVFLCMPKINSRLVKGPVEELSICVPSVEQDLSQSELWIEQSVLANEIFSKQTGTSTGKPQYRTPNARFLPGYLDLPLTRLDLSELWSYTSVRYSDSRYGSRLHNSVQSCIVLCKFTSHYFLDPDFCDKKRLYSRSLRTEN